MFKLLVNLWLRKKTKNYTEIPIFYMMFNYQKYKAEGKANSCTFLCYPDYRLANDEFVREHLQLVVDHIRDNYDLEKIARI